VVANGVDMPTVDQLFVGHDRPKVIDKGPEAFFEKDGPVLLGKGFVLFSSGHALVSNVLFFLAGGRAELYNNAAQNFH
jgi:hypothetical protein